MSLLSSVLNRIVFRLEPAATGLGQDTSEEGGRAYSFRNQKVVPSKCVGGNGETYCAALAK
jgi:hypothetical protein